MNAADEMGNKYIVLKRSDVKELDSLAHQWFRLILKTLHLNRIKRGDTNDNVYLVINRDEKYAPEIIEILKRHGHWG